MRLAWLVHNPAAGRFPSSSLVQRASSVFTSRGWSVHLETARQRDHLKDLIRRSVEASAEALIVAGGDGTVGMAASLLRGTQTALGVIPTGTANVWAREVGLPMVSLARPNTVDRVAVELAEGIVRRVDLGEANGRAFLLWAGTGLDARVVNLVEPRRRIDKVLPTTLYIVHTLRSARGWSGVDLEVVWPGGRVAGRYLLAVASNVRSYGGGLLRLAPMARVDDGLLEPRRAQLPAVVGRDAGWRPARAHPAPERRLLRCRDVHRCGPARAGGELDGRVDVVPAELAADPRGLKPALYGGAA